MIVHYRYSVDDNYGNVRKGEGESDTNDLVETLRPVLGSFTEEFQKKLYDSERPFRYAHSSQIAGIFVEVWDNDHQRKAMDDQVRLFELERSVEAARAHLADAMNLLREIKAP